MTGKDFLTLLLVSYGFTEVKISLYKGEGGAQGYEIEAYNKEIDDWFTEENCEGLMFNIRYIIDYMQENGIDTGCPFNCWYTPKEILKEVSKTSIDHE